MFQIKIQNNTKHNICIYFQSNPAAIYTCAKNQLRIQLTYLFYSISWTFDGKLAAPQNPLLSKDFSILSNISSQIIKYTMCHLHSCFDTSYSLWITRSPFFGKTNPVVSLYTSTNKNNQMNGKLQRLLRKKKTTTEGNQTIAMHKCIQKSEAGEFWGWKIYKSNLEI